MQRNQAHEDAHQQGQMAFGFGPDRRVYQVSELNAGIQRLFERDFQSIWVAGEISGCRPSAAGHYYFALKDRDSQVKCALFKGAARWAKFRPQDGLAVIARGSLDVYAPRGEFQMIVELLEPQGAGALQVAFEQLKRKLADEGLFAADRKRALPRLPRRIGLVTSQAGAVLRDMLHVLERRFPGLHIRLFPAQVQGEGAVEQVCQGLREFNEMDSGSGGPWPDVVIVARGGGSLEDLWSFNAEPLARAVAASKVPVISAVGHETDFTICDFVADYRAPTPSAAAEIVICTRESLLVQIVNCRAKFSQALRYRLLAGYRRLENSGAERAGRLLLRQIMKRSQILDDAENQLRRAEEMRVAGARSKWEGVSNRLAQSDLRLRVARSMHRSQQLAARLGQIEVLAARSQKVTALEESVVLAAQRRLDISRRRLDTATANLSQLGPIAVLKRGYAIVQDAEGRVVRAAGQTAGGDRLRVRLNQGELNVTVADEWILVNPGLPGSGTEV